MSSTHHRSCIPQIIPTLLQLVPQVSNWLLGINNQYNLKRQWDQRGRQPATCWLRAELRRVSNKEKTIASYIQSSHYSGNLPLLLVRLVCAIRFRHPRSVPIVFTMVTGAHTKFWHGKQHWEMDVNGADLNFATMNWESAKYRATELKTIIVPPFSSSCHYYRRNPTGSSFFKA